MVSGFFIWVQGILAGSHPVTEVEPCIHVLDLRLKYGQVAAVDGVSFDVAYGQVFGFLGPNGAGKTTTIKVLTTLAHPTSGTVSILGKDVVKNAKEIKKCIGVVLQEPSFEGNLTVEKALDLNGMMWGMPGERRRDRVRELFDKFDLEELCGKKNDDLSIGQRRRVQVAREFMHDMDLLFLDEPTVGLDPAARRTLLDYVKKQVHSGLTVFFTTHIMEEAEYLCDELAIINRGKVIAIDTPAGLKQKYGGIKAVEIKLREGKARSVMALLEPLAGDFVIETPAEDTIRMTSSDTQNMLVKIIEALAKNSVQIESVSVTPPTLEEVFLKVVNGDH